MHGRTWCSSVLCVKQKPLPFEATHQHAKAYSQEPDNRSTITWNGEGPLCCLSASMRSLSSRLRVRSAKASDPLRIGEVGRDLAVCMTEAPPVSIWYSIPTSMHKARYKCVLSE